jgi:hypothetical protein
MSNFYTNPSFLQMNLDRPDFSSTATAGPSTFSRQSSGEEYLNQQTEDELVKLENGSQGGIDGLDGLDVLEDGSADGDEGAEEGEGEGAEEGGVDNEEPLYVNAKQYHRILKRRAARQRLEELNRLARSRKVRDQVWPFDGGMLMPSPTCMNPDIDMRVVGRGARAGVSSRRTRSRR